MHSHASKIAGIKNPSLRTEVELSLAAGMVWITPKELDSKLAELGYKRDLDSRADCIAMNLNTGNRFPNVNYGVNEIDTGRSAYHFESRRDENFKELQRIRGNEFCVVRGAFWGI